MTEKPVDDFDAVNLDLACHIEMICRRFESDWREGKEPRVDDYLADAPDQGRATLRVELEALKRELEQAEDCAESAAPSVRSTQDATIPGPEARTVDYGVDRPAIEEAVTLRVVDTDTNGSSRTRHDHPTLPGCEGEPNAPDPGALPRIRYFGDYEIIREIARGGMGVVFQARQVSLNRPVALKMILAGQLANETDVKRFYTEAEAAANLDHPGIVPIFEVGKHEGQHYFSMGFVEGQSLVNRLAQGPLPARQAAELMLNVAEAIEYAHQRGVVHRDLKPGNILLDKNGTPRVTDFGLAKKVHGDSGLTASGQLMGTPSYMPPEQAGGKHMEVGPPADVYALGATLYCLVTGRPPFQAATAMDTVLQVIGDDPPSPRSLNPGVDRDIETICLKCLEKDPARRYASAAALASDLRRYLNREPIQARPVGTLERAWRWARREPALAVSLGAMALLLFAIAGISTISAGRLKVERDAVLKNLRRAQIAEADSQEKLFASLVSQAQARRVSRRMGQRFETLEALRQAADIGRELKLPPKKFETLRDEAIACMALPDLRPNGRELTRPPGALAVAFDSTMSRYALRFRGGTISVRRYADDQEIARFQALGDRDPAIFNFSPDGRYLATDDVPTHALNVWDVERRALVVRDPRFIESQAPFSPDSRRILAAQGKLHEYDLATGRLIRIWPDRVDRAVFRPDGVQIAAIDCGSTPQICRIHDAQSGRLVRKFSLRPGTRFVDTVAWNADGTTLATPCDDYKIDLWDTATGARRATLEGHTNGGFRTSFHPSGPVLASTGFEGRTWLWDPVLGRPWLTLYGGGSQEFSSDGRIVVSIEDRITPYQVDPALEYRTFAHVSSHRVVCHDPSIRHDGRVLAVASQEGGVVLWDLARGTELAFLPIGATWGIIFEASGDLLTSGTIGVRRWPIHLDLERSEFHIGPASPLPLPPSDCMIAQDRSARIVAQANHDFAFIATAERMISVGPLDDCRYVAVSPNGQWLATGSHLSTHGVQIWRIRGATKLAEPIDYGTAVLFSPDGKWLMTRRSPCRLWEVGTWREAKQQIGGEGQCFSPDGSELVVQDANQIIRLVETETGRTLAQLESPDLCQVQRATFSPDGSRLVVTTNDGPAVHVWDLRAIRRQLGRIGLDWEAPAYSDDDPASPTQPPLPPLQVDLGRSPLKWQPEPKFDESLIAGLETMLARQPEQQRTRGMLAHYCNTFAWKLAAAPGSTRDAQRALSLARRAVEVAPNQVLYLNTLGVAQYRAGRHAEAIATLEKSLAASNGGTDAFDLSFLAMARYRLGRVAEARADFDRALKWRRDHPNLSQPGWSAELDAFQAEARALLDGPHPELPADVFAPGPPDHP
jgi:WD40 repeat protein